jgi:hypothetical protein
MSGAVFLLFMFLYSLCFKPQNWGLFAGKWLVIRGMAVGVRVVEVGG